MKFVFIDHTITLSSPFNTGIQRTVRRIIEQSKKNSFSYKFRVINLNDLNNSPNIKNGFRIPTILKSSINIFLNKVGLYQLYHHSLFRLTCFIFFKKTDVNGSYFLNIDANWSKSNLLFIDRFRENGGKVISIYYDNGPYLYPEFFYPELVKGYREYWGKCIKNSDLILCISKTIRDELIELINKNTDILLEGHDIPYIDYFYLGHDHSSVDFEEFPIKASPTNGKRNYLVVGSIEPRKNNKYIFDSFLTLLKKKPKLSESINLIFIYNNSWKQDKLISSIHSSKYFNKNIFLLSDVNDRELLYFYQSSYALINASYYEGFGLGLAEAQSMGLKVFCSDIPVYKELFSTNAIFFNNLKSESLYDVILSDLAEPKPLKPSILFTWKNSFSMIIKKMNNI